MGAADDTVVLAAIPAAPPKRNLWVATGVGSAIFVAVLFGAWWHPLLFTIGLYLICIAATIEWRKALFASGRRVSQWPVTVALNNTTGSLVTPYNVQMAAALIASLPTLIVYILLGRYFMRGLMAGALKG